MSTQYPLTGNVGIAQLSSGHAVVQDTSVNNNTVILLTGYGETGTLRVSTVNVGVGFEIASSNPLDSGSVAYMIIGGQ